MDKIKQVIKSNIFLIVLIALSGIILLIASGTLDSAYNNKASLESELANLNNEIDKNNQSIASQGTVIIENELGLDLKRVNGDTVKMLEWITPAFTFKNSDEYNANRQIFIERLGENDQFVKEIMPPFIDGFTYDAVYDENGKIVESEGRKFNMEIAPNGFTAYVIGLDEETDVYSYLATVSINSRNENGYSGYGKKVVLTYKMDKDGNVTDFHAATPLG